MLTPLEGESLQPSNLSAGAENYLSVFFQARGLFFFGGGSSFFFFFFLGGGWCCFVFDVGGVSCMVCLCFFGVFVLFSLVFCCFAWLSSFAWSFEVVLNFYWSVEMFGLCLGL